MWDDFNFAEKMREIERLKRKTRQLEKRIDGVMWAFVIAFVIWMFS